MRISDWSSDVCSSDLINHVRAQIGGDVIGRAASLNFAGSGSECACLCRCLRLRGSSRESDAELLEAQQGVPRIGCQDFPLVDDIENREAAGKLDRPGDLADMHIARGEIGRASCRERVCQYV